MIDRELAKILRIFLYTAFVLTFIGLLVYSMHLGGKLVIELGIFTVLFAPLAEFVTILIFGISRHNKKFVLISLWMAGVFLFSSLKFFIFH